MVLPTDSKNYYHRLGISRTASSEEIAKAYRSLQKIHHPDKGGNEEISKLINEANSILSDPVERKKYDCSSTINNDDYYNSRASSSSSAEFSLPTSFQFSSVFRKKISKWMTNFSSLHLIDNFASTVQQITADLLQTTHGRRFDLEYKCKVCRKDFINFDYHYNSIVSPYIEALLEPLGLDDEDEENEKSIRLQDIYKEFQDLAICSKITLPSRNNNQKICLDFEQLRQFIDVIFEKYNNDEKLYDMLQMVLQIYPELMLDSSSLRIHKHFRIKLKMAYDSGFDTKAMEGNNDIGILLNGCEHIIKLHEPEFDVRGSSSSQLTTNLDKAIFDQNYIFLSDILASTESTNIECLTAYLSKKCGSYDLEVLKGPYKGILLSIRGTMKKLEKDWLGSISDYQNAINSYPDAEFTRCVSKLMQDVIHHKEILYCVYNELENLNINFSSGKCFVPEDYQLIIRPIKPNQLNHYFADRNIIESSMLVSIMKSEAVIDKHLSYLDGAYAYLDLALSVGTIGSKIGALAMAGSKFHDEMNRITNDTKNNGNRTIQEIRNAGATIYSLRNATLDIIDLLVYFGSRANPYVAIIAYRSALTLFLSSNQQLCTYLETMNNVSSSNDSHEPKNILDRKSKLLLSRLLNQMIDSTQVMPLVSIPSQSCLDMIYTDHVGLNFAKYFLKERALSLYQSTCLTFPSSLATYHYFRGIWGNWIKGDFYTSKFMCMKTLLEEKGWNFEQVEENMNWLTIERDKDGWIHPTKPNLDFNFDNEVQYCSFDGLIINGKTGDVKFLLSEVKENPGQPPLFSRLDLEQILQGGIDHGLFTLEQPDPQMPSHPFQQAAFFPSSLTRTEYLKTLLWTDLLLKQFTTGVELNSWVPFRTRKTQESLLNRLPGHLRHILRPIAERKDKSPNDTAHRFWISMEDIFYSSEESNEELIYKFGDVNVKIKKHLLVVDEEGNLVDSNQEEDEESAEAEFANDFTKYYNEVGQYFPEFLRLKELMKISIACRFIRGTYKGLQEALQQCANESSIDKAKDLLVKVKSNFWKNLEESVTLTIANNSHVPGIHGQTNQIRCDIKLKLIAAIVSQFETDLGITSCYTNPHVGVWLDGPDTSSSFNVLCTLVASALNRQKRERIQITINGLEATGFNFTEHNLVNQELIVNSESCPWIPAAFCNDLDEEGEFCRQVYGGVAMVGNVVLNLIPIVRASKVAVLAGRGLLQNVGRVVSRFGRKPPVGGGYGSGGGGGGRRGDKKYPPGPSKPSLKPGEGEVGTYGQLKRSPKPGMHAHHGPTNKFWETSPYSVNKNDGISIRIRREFHHQVNHTKLHSFDNPRDALAHNVMSIRKIYQNAGLSNEIRPSLIEFINRNKNSFVEAFTKNLPK